MIKKDGIMKHLFNFKTIIMILIIFLMVKLMWLGVGFKWLALDGVEHEEKVGGKSLYYRVKLSPNEAPAPKAKKKPVKKVKIAGSIKDIKLKAIYNSYDTTVITVEYKTKTKILGLGDILNGFVLEGGGSNYATFSKHSKTYRIDLKESKKSNSSSVRVSPVSTLKKPRVSRKVLSDEVEGEVTDAGDHKIIDRSLLAHYSKNIDSIYKNIGIRELKDGENIKGFKITFVRRGTPFAKLGLKRGDILKVINGQELNSYNVAFEAYKNIASMENVTLVIQRGKEEMELEYEVN